MNSIDFVNSNPQQLPKLPFKKSLDLCTMTFLNKKGWPEEIVIDFMGKVTAYKLTESKIPMIKEQGKTRQAFKEKIQNTKFKDSADFNRIFNQLIQETDKGTTNPMEELLRDSRIKFDCTIPEIDSEAYNEIKTFAQKYFDARKEVKNDVNYPEWKKVTNELKAYNTEFLRKNYTTVPEIKIAFDKHVNNLNKFLEGEVARIS